ncbi:MAG: hypothetical protein PHI23_05125, partial [Candidatus Peribacteraceae bacterium]|nr:hypothetical protein [Candidatus Peribacteraceae bacterium]
SAAQEEVTVATITASPVTQYDQEAAAQAIATTKQDKANRALDSGQWITINQAASESAQFLQAAVVKGMVDRTIAPVAGLLTC